MFKKGFTLVEIVIVIGLIGVLSGFVYVNMQNSRGIFSQKKIDSDIEILKNAIVSYSYDFYNDIPEGSGCLLQEEKGESCEFLPVIKPYIGFFPEPEPGVEYRYWFNRVNDSDVKIEIRIADGGQEVIIELPTEEDIENLPKGGVCGSIDGSSVTSEESIPDPTDPEKIDNFCLSGSLILEGEEGLDFDGKKWTWGCSGENTAIDSSCSIYLSANPFNCTIGTSCETSSINLLNIYSLTGSHAELPSSGLYENKVCCEGVNLSNNCTGGTTVLRLSGVTNAHVEKGTENYYPEEVCLSSTDKVVSCEYATACSDGYKCLVSISTGDTNLHIGDCTSAYATKVCCKID